MFFKSSRYKNKIQQIVCFIASLFFCLITNYFSLAQSIDAPQLVQQGANSYHEGEYQKALTYWEQALDIFEKDKDVAHQAIVEENLARTYQIMGQSEQAISYWIKVANYYRNHSSDNENKAKLGRVLTEQAQLYDTIGQQAKALAILCSTNPQEIESNHGCLSGTALDIARNHGDVLGEVAAIGSLGNTYRLLGDYDKAISCLQAIIPQEKSLETPLECQKQTQSNFQQEDYSSAAFVSLGNAYASRAERFNIYAASAQSRGGTSLANSLIQKASSDRKKAISLLKKSLDLKNTLQQQIDVLLNLIALENPSPQREKQYQDASELLKKLPNSRQKAYAVIKLAKINVKTSPSFLTQEDETDYDFSESYSDFKNTEQLLQIGLTTAKSLKDDRAQSFAMGELGHLYEMRQQYNMALDYSEQAQWKADSNIENRDSLYLWEWQTARILHKLGKDNRAMPAYQEAIATLDEVRENILTQEREFQLDFQDKIEPIYREFAEINIDLALEQKEDDKLDIALQTLDKLRVAELENYFSNDCVLGKTNNRQIKKLLGDDSAVFSSIILRDHTAIILSLPNGDRRLAWIETPQENLKQEIINFRAGLLDRNLILYGNDHNQKPQAEKLYRWIIAPFEADLKQTQVKNLIFVQDGLLRNIPMAALYDGSQFLVQKYAIGTTPSLTLTKKRTPRSQKLNIIAFGLTESAEVDDEFFPPLTQVKAELASIAKRFPTSKILLNEEFTKQNFKKAIKQAVNPIIHIATHGQFGTIPQDSFLVLGNNQKMTITELEEQLETLKNPNNSVNILALTACETAVGDKRAILGLAGTAVRAGVESTLASLWSIPDESTRVFVDLFYGFLEQGMNKAEALRATQLELILAENNSEINDDYNHPFYWSAFISIGNWL